MEKETSSEHGPRGLIKLPSKSNDQGESWYFEGNDLWPGQMMGFQVDKVIYEARSAYQDIIVFDSKSFGRVLALDGVIQLTEKDEFAYQEMMAFLPLTLHRCPQRVLVIGGGDGGVVRECLKHPDVQSVTLCELDQQVVQVARQFLPFMAHALDDPRVTVTFQDGTKFVTMPQYQSYFDVIITDSSDPVGPNTELFERPFYEHLKSCLRPGGIVCSQGESIWFATDLEILGNMKRFCESIFASVGYATGACPSYTSGMIGYFLASTVPSLDFAEPAWKIDVHLADQLRLRYYNADIHRASFVLPSFARKALSFH